MQFTPLVDFFSEEFKSEYLVGLSYTVRPQDAKLAALVPTWVDEGKVRPGVADGADASMRVKGSGKAE